MIKKLSSSVLIYDRRSPLFLVVGGSFLIFGIIGFVIDGFHSGPIFTFTIGVVTLLLVPWRAIVVFNISKGIVSIGSQNILFKKNKKEYNITDIQKVGLLGDLSPPDDGFKYITYKVVLIFVDGAQVPLSQVNSTRRLPFSGVLKMKSPGTPVESSNAPLK